MAHTTTPPQTLPQYSRAWYDMMARIWRDRIDLLGIRDTGRLRASIAKGGLVATGDHVEATFRFVAYGFYVDAGVGNGYRHGNGGDLHFLDRQYRREHHLGQPRKPRPWFSRAWRTSTRKLIEEAARIIGDDFAGAFDNL